MIKIIKKMLLYTLGLPLLVRKDRVDMINRTIEINELKNDINFFRKEIETLKHKLVNKKLDFAKKVLLLTKEPVVFDIGCANLGDSIVYKDHIKNSSVYAIEASKEFPNNEKTAEIHGIDYTNLALSDTTGNFVEFFPSDTIADDHHHHPYSGSIFNPNTTAMHTTYPTLTFKESYKVETISLDEFCTMKNIKPDFIHMDVQGAEYQILKNTTMRPKGIVLEVCVFDHYETGIQYSDLEKLLDEMGYTIVHNDGTDAYCILKEHATDTLIQSFDF